jgi:ribosomal protein L20
MKSKEKIEQLAENSSEVQEATYTLQHKITYQHGYIDGYTQCQEDMSDKKYTEEDVRKCWILATNYALNQSNINLRSFINSLNKQD